MINNIRTQAELEEVLCFIDECIKQNGRIGYPYVMFEKTTRHERIRQAFDHPEDVILYIPQQADLCLYVDRHDEVLSSLGHVFCKQNLEHYHELFVHEVHRRYPGYQWYVGYPSMVRDALALFRDEQPVEHSIFYEGSHSGASAQVRTPLLTMDLFDEFAAIHTQEMFWNADRVREHFDEWSIFIHRDTVIDGYVMVRRGEPAEIFAMKANDANQLSEMLCDVLQHFSPQTVLATAELHETMAQQALLLSGFTKTGDYVSYQIGG